MQEDDEKAVSRLSVIGEALLHGLRGLAMGAAEVMPGVSGGTIAFISGIYQRLIRALRSFSPQLLPVARREGPAGLWRAVDGGFLAALLLGMSVGLLLFATLVGQLLSSHPVPLWAFLGGLILASSLLMLSQVVRTWGVGTALCLCFGVSLGFFITYITPLHLEPTLPGFFLGGTIAVCAWILPGISGSFILLLLGLYAPVLHAVEALELPALASLAAGCAVGLMLFVRILEYLFRLAGDALHATLTGLMLGSLSVVWPWKQVLSYQIGRGGEQIPVLQEPISPAAWTALYGADANLFGAFLFMLLGMALVAAVQWLPGGGLHRART